MNIIHNTINIVNSTNSPNVLKDGNSVFVRILNATENPNKYIASFAGNLFEVTSKEKLLPGSQFRATIKLQGKTLQLIPNKISDTKAENQISKLDVKSFTENNQQIINLLKNLNLPQDKISLSLVQYFQQHQLKLDIPQIKKSRNKAKSILSKNSQISGKSENSSSKEINDADLINLSQLDLEITTKGFSFSEDNLEKLAKTINLFENPEENLNNSSENEESSTKEENSNEELNQRKKFLPFLNQVKNQHSSFHWIFLPFEIKIKDIRYFGNIRHLINLEDKKLQKTHIFCANDETKLYFMIYYSYKDNKSFKTIKYFCEPENNSKDILMLKEIFSDSQDVTEITFSEQAKMQDLFTEDLPITILELNA